MNMRQLNRRQTARQLAYSRIWAPDRFDVSYGYIDEDDEGVCLRCLGDGRDPWNDHVLPCPVCRPEGLP